MKLGKEHLSFFKAQGYLILNQVLDLELCAWARDRLWSTLPQSSRIKRDDRSTHIGPFDLSDINEDVQELRSGYRWQLRKAGTESNMVRLVFSETLQAIAQQLLGSDTLIEPVINGSTMGRQGAAWPEGPVDPALGNEGARGIYATLPYKHKDRLPEQCHTDGHPFQLGLGGLIDDVLPAGGGFKVWPGSHSRLYPTFIMQYDQPRIPYYDHLPTYKGILHTPEYLEILEAISKDTPSVDCYGRAGDIVLWHHRLAHMAGHNYSAQIRHAILYDFSTNTLDQNRLDPPQNNMWRDWSHELQESSLTYSPEFAKSQHLIP